MLCDHCKEPYTPDETQCRLFGLEPATRPVFHHAKGCAECNYQGYRGRTGVYELAIVDHEMRTLIHNNAGEHELEAHARRFTPGIRHDGLRNVLAGRTTVEEVLRVTQED